MPPWAEYGYLLLAQQPSPHAHFPVVDMANLAQVRPLLIAGSVERFFSEVLWVEDSVDGIAYECLQKSVNCFALFQRELWLSLLMPSDGMSLEECSRCIQARGPLTTAAAATIQIKMITSFGNSSAMLL